MKLHYIGPLDGVIVPLPTGGQVECERDGIVDVPDSYAERLLEQVTNWEPAATPAKASKSTEKGDD